MSMSPGIRVTRVAAGAAAVDWLQARIAELKAGDPLAPVTVVVPVNHAGLFLRRRLARSGYANVRFGVLGRLAEPLGSPELARAGRRPLTPALEEAAIRRAIPAAGDAFGAVAGHPALVATLRELFRELRDAEVEGAALEGLTAWGRMAAAAVAVYREYEDVRAGARAYDDRDLLDAATAGVSAHRRLVDEAGPVILFLPTRVWPAGGRFLAELSRHTSIDVALAALGDEESEQLADGVVRRLGVDLPPPDGAPVRGDVRIQVAPDSTEEIRALVRRLLHEAEAGADLGRTAIAYRDSDPYAALVRDTLDSAGVPWAAIDGRPLADSWPGRSLAGMLALRESEFARIDVLGWLGALPVTDPGAVSIADWDRISRDAGIVKGASQWSDRLALSAKGARERADAMEREGHAEGSIRRLRYQAGAAERMAEFIGRVAGELRGSGASSWKAHVDWAKRTRHRYAPVSDRWPDREREADEMVDSLLDELAAAGDLEPEIDFDGFVTACAGALQGRRQAEGRLGSGVTVGPISAMHGMDFEVLLIAGATEHAFPKPAPPDPVFPPRGEPDPLGRESRRQAEERRDFVAALGSAPRVVLSTPAWDAEMRPVFPSPWVIEMVKVDGSKPGAAAVRLGRSGDNVELIRSPLAALESTSSYLNLAEWRTAEMRRGHAALIARPELPLGRNLEVNAARRSDAFTEFDGNLASIAAEHPTLAAGLAGERPVSASAIADWAKCGFAYLLKRVLHVPETNRPEQDIEWSLDSLTRGNLYHAILERFFVTLREQGRPAAGEAYTPADDSLIREIAAEEFAGLHQSGFSGNPLAWENEQSAILADLETFLEKDTELRASGLRPWAFEQSFGGGSGSWAAPEIELEPGRSVRLNGRIDRVDLGPDPENPEDGLVIDYKSGAARIKTEHLEADPVGAGEWLQPAVYSEALRHRFPGIAARGAYWFVTAKGGFEQAQAPDGTRRLTEVLRLIDQGVRDGAFPQVPGGETSRPGIPLSWDNCLYCPFDRICPTGREMAYARKASAPAVVLHGSLRLDGSDTDAD